MWAEAKIVVLLALLKKPFSLSLKIIIKKCHQIKGIINNTVKNTVMDKLTKVSTMTMNHPRDQEFIWNDSVLNRFIGMIFLLSHCLVKILGFTFIV